MFLLVSGRHVGAHPDGHQNGGSIQISINLGKTFHRISCMRKIAVTWNLARVFAYSPSFFSQNLDFIYWMVLIFILNSVTLKTSNRALWWCKQNKNWTTLSYSSNVLFCIHIKEIGNNKYYEKNKRTWKMAQWNFTWILFERRRKTHGWIECNKNKYCFRKRPTEF